MHSIFAISGSLRAASVNTALLTVMAQLAPPGMRIDLFTGMASLPLFNPDLDDAPPAAVLAFRAALHAADAVVIASPEYAHGVTGVIKNALDWIVGSGELENKPVALLSAATRAMHGPEALRKTLLVMGARLIDGACIAVPVNNSRADAAAILALRDAVAALHAVLAAIHLSVDAVAAPG